MVEPTHLKNMRTVKLNKKSLKPPSRPRLQGLRCENFNGLCSIFRWIIQGGPRYGVAAWNPYKWPQKEVGVPRVISICGFRKGPTLQGP